MGKRLASSALQISPLRKLARPRRLLAATATARLAMVIRSLAFPIQVGVSHQPGTLVPQSSVPVRYPATPCKRCFGLLSTSDCKPVILTQMLPNEGSLTLPPASPRPATGRLYDQPVNCCCIVCESIGPSTYESAGASDVNSRSKFPVSRASVYRSCQDKKKAT